MEAIMTVPGKRFAVFGRDSVSRFIVAAITIGLLAATAKAEAPVPAVEVPAVAPCDVVESDSIPDLSTVLEVIKFCPDDLALSDAQRDQLAMVQSAYVDGILRREARRFLVEASLMVLLRVDLEDPGRPVDIAAAEVRIREMERMASEDQISTLRAVEASKAVLTAAQRATLASLLGRARGDATPKIDL
jgi:hypothetical protein